VIWRSVRILALGVVVAIAVKVGWDNALWDPRLQAFIHLVAALAIGALAWMALRGKPMPRTRIDLPLLALLVAYGVATLSAWNIGLSAPALAGIVTTALMLPVALLALRHRPNLTALVVVVPVIGLAAISLWTLAWRRIDWVVAGGPGWPPVRLANEVTQFGLVTIPPFVLLAALPLALVVTRPDLRRWLVWTLLALCAPLTLVSGSRSAWIAFGVAGLVMAALSIGELRAALRLSPRRIGAGAALLAVGAVGVAYVAPRLTQTSSLLYRGTLWDTTLHVWIADPLLGIGPGGMAYARQAIAPLVQPHSHDVPLGILGDAGLVGLLLALVLFVRFAWVARPRRGRPLPGRAAYAVLMGVAAGFLTDDLTFLPNVNLLLILVIAVALRDTGAVAWRPLPRHLRGWWAGGMAAAAVGLLSVAILADASAIWYRTGTDAVAAGRWTNAEGAFAMAVQLDPGHPAGAKALSLAADHEGLTDLARRSAALAVFLNAGDWASWTNLSLLCLKDGDSACAAQAAQRALDTSDRSGVTLVNAALVFRALGRSSQADALYEAALLTDWETGLLVPWPRPLALPADPGIASGTFNRQLALLVARRQRGDDLKPESYALASVRALAFAMEGNRGAARSAIAAAYGEQPADPVTWDIAALLLAHWGEDNSTALRLGNITRGWPLPTEPPEIPALSYDIGSFRSYPGDGLIRAAQRLIPTQPWPWDLEPLLPR
jgi:O-antigen ligase